MFVVLVTTFHFAALNRVAADGDVRRFLGLPVVGNATPSRVTGSAPGNGEEAPRGKFCKECGKPGASAFCAECGAKQ